MKRLQAFFGGLVTPSTSEFWLGWGGIVLNVLCHASQQACALIGKFSVLFNMTPEVFVGTLLAIALGRMVSKAAKATA